MYHFSLLFFQNKKYISQKGVNFSRPTIRHFKHSRKCSLVWYNTVKYIVNTHNWHICEGGIWVSVVSSVYELHPIGICDVLDSIFTGTNFKKITGATRLSSMSLKPGIYSSLHIWHLHRKVWKYGHKLVTFQQASHAEWNWTKGINYNPKEHYSVQFKQKMENCFNKKIFENITCQMAVLLLTSCTQTIQPYDLINQTSTFKEGPYPIHHTLSYNTTTPYNLINQSPTYKDSPYSIASPPHWSCRHCWLPLPSNIW